MWVALTNLVEHLRCWAQYDMHPPLPSSAALHLPPPPQTPHQVWLAVTNLVVDPRCRAKYDMDDYRRDALLRMR